ncbi:hypothetical protein VTG60DRAFT_4978 [Thermothelomyces hinnuleus]
MHPWPKASGKSRNDPTCATSRECKRTLAHNKAWTHLDREPSLDVSRWWMWIHPCPAVTFVLPPAAAQVKRSLFPIRQSGQPRFLHSRQEAARSAGDGQGNRNLSDASTQCLILWRRMQRGRLKKIKKEWLAGECKFGGCTASSGQHQANEQPDRRHDGTFRSGARCGQSSRLTSPSPSPSNEIVSQSPRSSGGGRGPSETHCRRDSVWMHGTTCTGRMAFGLCLQSTTNVTTAMPASPLLFARHGSFGYAGPRSARADGTFFF